MNKLHDLAIEYVSFETLSPWPGNARRGDVPHILTSMERNGVYAPITVQRSSNRIIIGNHRFLALKEFCAASGDAWPMVPVIYLDIADEAAERINTDDNKASDMATWDLTALQAQLGRMYEDSLGTLEGSGFTDAEYTQMLLDASKDPAAPIILDGETLAAAARESEPGDIAPEQDNTRSTAAVSHDYRLIVYLDNEGARDDLVADLRSDGYNASAIG